MTIVIFIADFYKLEHLYLQVHLSDDGGMEILVQLLWQSAYLQLNTPAPAPQVSLRTSPPVRRFVPKVVVKGEVTVPPPSDPFQWTRVGKRRKVRLSTQYLCL